MITTGILGSEFLSELHEDRTKTKGKFATTGAGMHSLKEDLDAEIKQLKKIRLKDLKRNSILLSEKLDGEVKKLNRLNTKDMDKIRKSRSS